MAPVAVFIRICYEMFTDPKYSHCCGWGPSDDTIVIYNVKEFSQNVLPENFKTSKFESFARQLNMYEFKKIGQSQSYPFGVEYSHQFFKKGRFDLLSMVKRLEQPPRRIKSSISISFPKEQEMVPVRENDLTVDDSISILLSAADRVNMSNEQHQRQYLPLPPTRKRKRTRETPTEVKPNLEKSTLPASYQYGFDDHSIRSIFVKSTDQRDLQYVSSSHPQQQRVLLKNETFLSSSSEGRTHHRLELKASSSDRPSSLNSTTSGSTDSDISQQSRQASSTAAIMAIVKDPRKLSHRQQQELERRLNEACVSEKVNTDVLIWRPQQQSNQPAVTDAYRSMSRYPVTWCRNMTPIPSESSGLSTSIWNTCTNDQSITNHQSSLAFTEIPPVLSFSSPSYLLHRFAPAPVRPGVPTRVPRAVKPRLVDQALPEHHFSSHHPPSQSSSERRSSISNNVGAGPGPYHLLPIPEPARPSNHNVDFSSKLLQSMSMSMIAEQDLIGIDEEIARTITADAPDPPVPPHRCGSDKANS